MNNTLLKKISVAVLLTLIAAALFCALTSIRIHSQLKKEKQILPSDESSSMMGSVFVFPEDARATGGTITFLIEGESFEIPTRPGQTASDIAAQIAATVTSKGYAAETIKNTTVSFASPSVYACSLTESDLGIPPPPQVFHCQWNEKEQILNFTWGSPIHYDFLMIVDSTEGRFNRQSLDGTNTKYRHHVNKQTDYIFPGRNIFGVVGVTKGIPCKVTCEINL